MTKYSERQKRRNIAKISKTEKLRKKLFEYQNKSKLQSTNNRDTKPRKKVQKAVKRRLKLRDHENSLRFHIKL